ncbi:MAG TPA: SRPBCC family protein [Streptosporangiaceae bacterium]|nr:SRPBCC family protein [Streptosporangiaceae bacterium]
MAEEARSSTFIGAPRETVMAVIADFDAYPRWAGSFRSVEVTEPGDDGRARQVRMVVDAGFIKDTLVLKYEWDADIRSSWELATPTALLSALHGSYTLADHDTGTEVTYNLTIHLRIPMLGIIKRRAIGMIIDQALHGLKRYTENLGDAR